MSVDQITRTYEIAHRVSDFDKARSDLERAADEKYMLVRGREWMTGELEAYRLPLDAQHERWVRARFVGEVVLCRYDKSIASIVEVKEDYEPKQV